MHLDCNHLLIKPLFRFTMLFKENENWKLSVYRILIPKCYTFWLNSSPISVDLQHYISDIIAFIQPRATVTVNDQIKTWSSDLTLPKASE